MSEYLKIEKNVPMMLRGQEKYPFKDMQVGDSFLCPPNKVGTFRQCAYLFGKKNGVKFSIRRTGDGFRIWRIK